MRSVFPFEIYLKNTVIKKIIHTYEKFENITKYYLRMT